MHSSHGKDSKFNPTFEALTSRLLSSVYLPPPSSFCMPVLSSADTAFSTPSSTSFGVCQGCSGNRYLLPTLSVSQSCRWMGLDVALEVTTDNSSRSSSRLRQMTVRASHSKDHPFWGTPRSSELSMKLALAPFNPSRLCQLPYSAAQSKMHPMTSHTANAVSLSSSIM
jgi:hypothetical protein